MNRNEINDGNRKTNISRRDFIKGAAASAVGVATMGIMGAGFPVSAADSGGSKAELTYDVGRAKISQEELTESVVETAVISKFDEEVTYDVIVVGAGTAGVPAALTALEKGATVAVLQKETVAISQGNLCAAVVLDESTEAGVMAFLHEFHTVYDHRSSWEQNKKWVYSSGEAVSWIENHLSSAGYEDLGSKHDEMHTYEDGKCFVHCMFFSKGNGLAFIKLAEIAEKAGVKFYYETPAVQLIKNQDRVVGVIGKDASGKYIKFNAAKGVILATGDYQNNSAMVDKYCPDAAPFVKKQVRKTGDGHLMGMLAGAKMEPIGHTKMIHGNMGPGLGSGVLRNEPFLAVNLNGERFTYEDIPFERRNMVLLNQPEQAWITIMDENYYDQVLGWGNDPEASTIANGSRQQIADYVKNGNVYKADTLEGLANDMGLPANALKSSVTRYNELCALGYDLDYGKPSKYMQPVNTPPYYGMRREYAVSALTSGLMTDANAQCLDENGNVIPGLFAVGNCAGPFYGDIDYSLFCMGMSVSRCVTFGRIAGLYAASL